MNRTLHIAALAVLLILFCIGYTILTIANAEEASAIGIGFIAIVVVTSLLLRLLRRI